LRAVHGEASSAQPQRAFKSDASSRFAPTGAVPRSSQVAVAPAAGGVSSSPNAAKPGA
jgi:hypothetical protein